MAGPLNLAEARNQLNITGTGDDQELLRFLTAATDLVESIVGPLAPRTVVERHHARSGTICLRVLPVLSVTSIASRPGSIVLYSGDALDVDPDSGVVYLATGAPLCTGGLLYGFVTVTYVAGRESVPEPIRVATGVILDQLWQTQRGWASGAPTALGEFEQAPPAVPMGFALPARAEQQLEPYRQLAI